MTDNLKAISRTAAIFERLLHKELSKIEFPSAPEDSVWIAIATYPLSAMKVEGLYSGPIQHILTGGSDFGVVYRRCQEEAASFRRLHSERLVTVLLPAIRSSPGFLSYPIRSVELSEAPILYDRGRQPRPEIELSDPPSFLQISFVDLATASPEIHSLRPHVLDSEFSIVLRSMNISYLYQTCIEVVSNNFQASSGRLAEMALRTPHKFRRRQRMQEMQQQIYDRMVGERTRVQQTRTESS